MVHIKYTYKDGKKFGPYFYETKRVDGKIITNYLGTKFPNTSSPIMRFSLNGVIPFFVIIGILLLLFLPFNFTGNAALNIKSSYELGEAIYGDLTFILNEGEIIPADSKLLLTYGNNSKEVLLSSIISEEILSGEFYAEGVSLSGNGKGYGVIGTKTIYPEISFSLKISEDKSSDSDSSSDVSSIPDSTSSNETGEITKEEVAKEEETDKKENVEENVKDIAKEEEISDEQEIESSAGITGSVISGSDNVFGVVSKENDFVYELSEDESADLIEGSVKYNGSIIEDNVVKLRSSKNELVVSTDYSLELEGFGEDFAGNNQKKLKIDLNQFDFIANQNAVFLVSLVYGDVEIISVNEIISVSNVAINNENTTAISNNLSTINQTIIANSTILNNVTEINQTVIANFTISTSLNDSTLAVNLTQFSAVLGQPVKWNKRIAFNVNGSVELSVELPESAKNITLNPLNLTEYLETETLTSEEITALTSVSPEIVLVNETIPVQEVIIGVTGNIITGQVSANIDLSKENWLKNLFGRLFGITGRVVETVPIAPNPQSVSVNLSDADFGVEVEYYTNAPIAIEFDEGTNKKIAISSPADVHYENVLIFTNLSDSLRITDLANIRIEWAENNSQNMEIYSANDSNKDGNYDYIEWIAPHLSNQTFNIIVIIDAQHLNETLGFISNIYNETKELDDIWSEVIPDGHYVRVTFERNLTSVNDITIYLRASNGTNISDVSINIYEKNSSEIIAQFNQLYEQKYNKIYLTNLSNRTQDTFDLLVLGGSVEFDHIIDPTIIYGSYSKDIGLAPLDNETFVISYLNASSNQILFSIINTNGTIVLNPVAVDGGTNISYNHSRVSVATFNSTTFMIGWTNRSADRRATYTRTGVLKSGPSFGDGSIGVSAHDIQLTYMEDKVFYCYTDFTEGDSDLRIYNATTNAAYGLAETDINTALLPAKNNTNLIDCVVVNSTRIGYFEFDDGTDDDATYHFANATGAEIVPDVDIDTAASDNGRVAVASLDTNKLILVWHNTSDVRIAIRGVDNSSILAGTRVSITGSGTRSQLTTATVKNSSSNLDNVVIVWYNQTNTRLLGKAYNGSGTVVTNEFVIDEDPVSEGLSYALGENDASGITLCPGKWIVAYTNLTNISVIKSYDLNGSLWDGVCGVSAVADTTYPIFSSFNETPSNNSNYNSSLVYSFNVTINNTNGTAWLRFNSINYTATNITYNIFNVSLTNLSAGDYYYNWSAYGNGTSKLFNISSTLYYTVAKASSEVNLTINSTEGNISIQIYEAILLNGTKIVGDVAYTLKLYNNGTLINEGNNSISNLTNFTNTGLYNITLLYLNTQNYTQSSETYYVNVTQIIYVNLTASILNSNLSATNITFMIYPQGSSSASYNSTNLNHNLLQQVGNFDLEYAFENNKIKKIRFINYSIQQNLTYLLKYEEDINSTIFDSTFAVEVNSANYTLGNLTFNATADTLYKCANWNFTSKICQGEWKLLLNNLTIGEEYSILLTPGDPGYGQINISDAIHLNENYSFINNQYVEVVNLDNLWSERINHREYIRITFVQNLTSLNDITIYPRNTQNRSTIVEIYIQNTTTKLTQSPVINLTQYYKMYLTNLSAANESDTFDLRILNLDNLSDSYLEFDHIIDPNVGHNYSLVNPANGSSSTIRSVNLTITLDDQDGSGAGGQALVYVETNTTAFTNEHLVYVANSLTDPQTITTNYSIPLLKYTANSGMFLLYHFDNNTQFGENLTLVNDFATGAFDGTIAEAIRPMTSSVLGRGFDNKGGRISLTDAALLNSPSVTGEITIMFWVNMTTTHFPVGFPPIVSKQVDTNNRDYLIYFTNSSKVWTLALGNTTTATSTSTTGFTTQNNTWYHLAFTFNKTTQNASIFVNGIVNRSATMALTNALIDTAASLILLKSGTNNNLNNSIIDDLAIYNKTLTAQEILDVYRLTDGKYYWRVNSSDAVGLWNNSDTYQFSVDNIQPNVNLNYPDDGESFLNTVPISFNWTTTDFVDTSMNCNLTIDSVVNRTSVVSANNTMVNVSVTGLSVANHLWNVTCIDDAGNSNTSSTITVRVASANNAPYNGTVLFINSTSGTNYSNQDLNAYTTLLDLNNNSMNVTVNWYNNTKLHLTFEYNNSYVNGTTFIATLGKGNTTKGHNWTAGFTLHDGAGSFIVNSNNLTVKNTPPNASLISPVNGSITLNRTTQNFIWAGSDDDGETIQYDLNISLVALSACTDTVFNGNNLINKNSDSYALSSVTPEQLNCFSDNNDYYKWSVRGVDSEGLIGSFTAPFNISLQALISASLNISLVEFGNLEYLKSNNTESNSPKPFILVNDGNAMAHVKLSATNLWQSVANPSSNYQAKIANVTTNGLSENGSFSWASSTTNYASMPVGSTNFISSLNFTDVTDSAEVDINITVPSGEGPGLKTSTVTFAFSFAEVPG